MTVKETKCNFIYFVRMSCEGIYMSKSTATAAAQFCLVYTQNYVQKYCPDSKLSGHNTSRHSSNITYFYAIYTPLKVTDDNILF